MRIVNFTFFAGMIVVAACSTDATGPIGKTNGEPLQTDALSYSAHADGYQYSFKVVTRFQNTLDRTVYLDRCRPEFTTPMFGVLAADSAQTSAYDELWGCVGADNNSFAVAPGATRVDTLTLRGPNAFSVEGEPFGQTSGLHRIEFIASFCPDECQDRVPSDALISNSFRVTPEGDAHF